MEGAAEGPAGSRGPASNDATSDDAATASSGLLVLGGGHRFGGGSTQPYHAVIDTPGPGWMVRCNSKKYLEDGLFEIACAPYGKVSEENPADQVVVGYGGF